MLSELFAEQDEFMLYRTKTEEKQDEATHIRSGKASEVYSKREVREPVQHLKKVFVTSHFSNWLQKEITQNEKTF